ncbi:hypothetical protein [Anaerocolumna sp.]|uniref:hypothetical protein n=1 Tax=Anaerocolumna sp. TaxID=2041569 RepID=UPI0028B14B65|nr:hypothetical protein [Anaerocolumna sp.]
MKYQKNLIKNENLKFTAHKTGFIMLIYGILFCIISIKAYSGSFVNRDDFPNNMKYLINNLNVVNYLKLASTDLVYGGTTQFSLIVVALNIINIFTDDILTGNYKYLLLTGIQRKQYALGKFIYSFCINLMFILWMFILGLVLGSIVFGTKGVTIVNLLEVLGIYLMTIFPMMALTGIIAIFSTAIHTKAILTIGSIILIITLGICDSFTKSKYISPTGMLSLFTNDAPMSFIDSNIFICAVTSFTYFILTLILYYNKIKKEDLFI